jgi:DNA sulfur modification protein DndD
VRLASLRMHNFMPYRGDHEIRFPVDGPQNVVVIYGDNMRGKTSVLNAIRWSLYGEVRGRHSRRIPLTHLLNKDAAKIRDFEMKVALGFVHDGVEFEMVRTMKPRDLIDTPRDDGHFEVFRSLRKSGTPVSAHLIDHEINQILPEEISRFSLFDGELLQEYEQLVAEATEESDRIKSAIEHVLGVPTLTHARDHLSELLQRANRQFAKEGAKDTQHGKYIDDLLTQLEASQREEKKLSEMISQQQAASDDLDEKLRQFERAEGIKAQVEEIRRQQKLAMEAHDRAVQRRSELSPKAWMAVVEAAISERKDALQEQLLAARDKYESLVRAKVLRQLKAFSLQSGRCATCEQPIPEEFRSAIRQDVTSGEAAGTDLDGITESLVALSKQYERLRGLGAPGVAEDVVRAEREIDRATVESQRHHRREGQLLEEIPGVELSDLTRWREQREGLQREIGNLQGKLAQQRATTIALQRKYDSATKLAAGGQQGGAALIGRKVTLLSGVGEVFEKSIDRLRHKLSLTVQFAATDAFKVLSTESKYRGLVINSRYGLEIRDHEDRPVSVRSAGAEQIVALSLIDGLNKASGKKLPLVMDTPFGRLDPKHRANVLRYLPRMAEQVVLLVHEGELSPDRDLIHITDYVAARYEIDRVSPTHSEMVRR